ncbi:hypothetical protein SAMN04488515_1787 [Cognatiyoonia koreensis]|uniref:Uncharacterized protein n=1 Tax=Cognatiyoonia koreensis TaxID=364200 RepID=A0A1I0QBF3_9RHOB|nr:hypothetical protein [Cognatiyoonia koreensis]SEW24121.1 hypothetical protein SAMN04488515_1787 [Cognatiyoonia koreensis]
MFCLIKSIVNRGLQAVDIALHLGAHRCATTTFQTFLDQNRQQLAGHGVQVWTPANTRAGLFDGLICPPDQDATREIARARTMAAGLQASQLVVSEENMIGTPRNNLAVGALYPGLTPRLQRFEQVFKGQVRRIGLAIRSYESYWVSTMSYAAIRGHALPDRAACAALATQQRSWTDIASEIRALFPSVPLHIWLFEVFANRPRRQFNMLSGRQDITHLLDQTPAWKNTSRTARQLRKRLKAQGRLSELALLPLGDQRWQPFTSLEQHHMAGRYADDIAYFRSGTDPLIQFTQNAAIKVLRRNNTRATPAFDIGEYHDGHAEMG